MRYVACPVAGRDASPRRRVAYSSFPQEPFQEPVPPSTNEPGMRPTPSSAAGSVASTVLAIARLFAPRALRLLLHRCRKERWYRFFLTGLFPFVYFAHVVRLRRRPSMEQIKNVLITSFGAIGDTLLITPAIRDLAAHLPQATITVLVSHRGAVDVLKNNPHVQKVELLKQYDRGSVKLRFADSNVGLFQLYQLYPGLVLRVLLRRFGVGISLSFMDGAANFSSLLFRLSGITYRVGAYRNHRSYFTHFLGPESCYQRHWVDVYRDVIALLGSPSTGDALDFAVSATDRECARALLRQRELGVADSTVAINPGGGALRGLKQWNPSRYAVLADRLCAELDSQIVFTGDPDEVSLIEEITRKMTTKPLVAAACTSLTELGALLERVDLLITNDTGTLHVAEAVGTRQVIALFGPSDPRRIAPRSGRTRVLYSDMECSPCIVFGADDQWERCSREIKQECLERISVSQVFELARTLLRETDVDGKGVRRSR